jgi:ribonucleoside-diphosphate reductase alpha subunit
MITERNEDLCSNPAYGLELAAIDSPSITTEVVRRFRNGMTTRELDAETASICAQLATHHSDYEWLAARVYVSDLHKRTPAELPAMIDAIVEAAPDRSYVRLSDEFVAIARRADPAIATRLDFRRDFHFRFFGYQTIARSYLLRPSAREKEQSTLLGDQLLERPQHLYMRIALGVFVCQPDGRGHEAADEVFAGRLADAFQFYDALSLQCVSNATPTMLNASTIVPQLSSCFQVATGDDLATLYDTLKSIALISKWSGGVSLWIHNVRAEGAPIRKTGGRSSGMKRYVKVLDDTQEYVDQGGNRKGAFAIYMGVEHDDIFTFLALGRLKGEEALKELNSPNLKYALWIPDLFMEALVAQLENDARVEAGGLNDPTAGDWYLFCPDTAPGLHLVYGEAYRELYGRYVAEKRYRRRVKAGDIILEAYRTWTQTGVPYVLFKDSFNRNSNMQNVATICSSNLCCEVAIPSWSAFDAPDFARFHPGNDPTKGEFGVCNLAAICLESFLAESPDAGEDPTRLRHSLRLGVLEPLIWLDFAGIIEAAALETRALNRVIDLNFYPSEECRRSNRRHRPIGIGIMGLADVLARLRLVYGSPEARGVARAIAAVVYYGAVLESTRLAEIEGPYETFAGSPISQGRLQPDLWAETGHLESGWEEEVERLTGGAITAADWFDLRARARRGVRNAYLTAYMPTATTSNIVGQNECFEPFTSNIYTRNTQAGEFIVANRHLMTELGELELWDDQMRRDILTAGGSVQGISRIPLDVRRRYRTAREIHPSLVILMAKAMAPFVCQSMSMNLFLDEPDLPKILRFLIEGWQAGLKTGLYYCHTKPATGSQKTSVRDTAGPAATVATDAACSADDGSCTVCSV